MRRFAHTHSYLLLRFMGKIDLKVRFSFDERGCVNL
jgi:hypothetical protein